MTWITIPNWDRFQHYGTHRRPPWIKNYTSLLQKDEYLDLPLAARGLLHGIWLAYADRDGRLRQADLPATLLARARDAHIHSLNHAGLIELRASRPLPLSLEKEGEPPAKALDAPPGGPTSAELRAAAEAYCHHDHGPTSIDVDDAMLLLARGWLEHDRR